MGSPAELSGPDEVAAGPLSLGAREGQKQQQCLERMTLQCRLEGVEGRGLEVAQAKQVPWEGSALRGI